MRWFALVPGIVLTAIGGASIFRGDAIPSAIAMTALGLFWVAMVVFVARIQGRADQLRTAHAKTDPDAAQKKHTLQRLTWLQWLLMALGFAWIFAALPFSAYNVNLPIYGFIAFLAASFAVMLYRLFIIGNLGAAAFRSLRHSLSGRVAPPATSFQKFGTGAMSIVVAIALVGGVLADEFSHLPFKFMPLFWWGMGLILLGAIGLRIWREVRRRLPKR
jgi:hypothetical protein